MFERVRLLTILAPAVLVGLVELLSDTYFDQWLPFPVDTILVVLVVLVASMVFSHLAFKRIGVLSATLEARNRELEARHTSARALHRTSVAIAAIQDLDQILSAICDNARTLLDTDVALLVLAGPDDSLVLRAWSGPAEAIDPMGGQAGSGPSRFGVPDVLVARLEAPLRRAETTVGTLAVGSRVSRSFEIDDLETLGSLANQAAIALEHARLQAQLQELAVVAERERIAREMHDGLAQVLAYVNTKSQAVEELLAADRITEARTQLDELAAAARSIYVDVREAILGLRSPIAPGGGLVAAIEEYAAAFAAVSKLAVRVHATAEVRALPLAPGVESQLFRIIQEGLTNVRKHAAARRADISLEVSDARLTIQLVDDGRGFHGPGSPGDWPHYGKTAMRERAAATGAEITWSSNPDGGTVVRVVGPAPTGAEPAWVGRPG